MKRFVKENWGLLLLVAGFVIFMFFMIRDMVEERRVGKEVKDYCGPVIDKGYDPPSSGHKSHTDSQYWIILQDENCHKAIRVNVTPSAFYSSKKDERVCFSLSGFELLWYGNTNEAKHLK